MIVDPDFLDHWKTQMLVDLLGGDELAPMYIMRLWGHCQNRKAWKFDGLPTPGLKAICRYKGDAESFEKALAECGFVARNDGAIEVCGWAEHNASLVACWENGGKGGRPKKETQRKPSGNPAETHAKPSGNPAETHAKPIREDKIREEKRSKEKPYVADSRDEVKTSKWTTDDKLVAEEILKGVQSVAPSAKWSASWPDQVRLMREREGKTHAEMLDLFRWANADSFWRTNILSPAKLRKQWTQLEARMNAPRSHGPPFQSRHDRTQQAIEEFAGESFSERVVDGERI